MSLVHACGGCLDAQASDWLVEQALCSAFGFTSYPTCPPITVQRSLITCTFCWLIVEQLVARGLVAVDEGGHLVATPGD